MRKILYSPGYGAGWVSWFHGTREQKRFMLEYKPFIDEIEEADTNDRITVFEQYYKLSGDKYFETIDCVIQFKKDWDARFPCKPYPCFGGLRDLAIYEVHDDCLVKIDDHDGNEHVQIVYPDKDVL